MADIWSSLYDALQAPANERMAREDAMRNAPTYQQLLAMTQTTGTEPIGKTDRYGPASPGIPTGNGKYRWDNPDQTMGQTRQRWNTASISPYMTPAERVMLSKQIGTTPQVKDPIDITVRGGNTVNTLLAMMGGSRGGAAKQPQVDTSFPGTAVRYKTAIGPQLKQQPGVNNVSGQMNPGYQLGDGALAFATQNSKQPIKGLSGLLASLFGGSGTAVGTKLDTRGPGPGELYNLSNQRGALAAIMAPRTGTSTNGYVYQNGQNVGTTRAPGESAASQYDRAAAAARASSPDNGGNPSWW